MAAGGGDEEERIKDGLQILQFKDRNGIQCQSTMDPIGPIKQSIPISRINIGTSQDQPFIFTVM